MLHSDSFNIASVLAPTASSAMPDLLSDRPPSPVAEFGMPADIGGALPAAECHAPYPAPSALCPVGPACCGGAQQLCSSSGWCIGVVGCSPILTNFATAGEPNLRSYTPLKAEDHQRCGMAFTMKVRPQPRRSCVRRVIMHPQIFWVLRANCGGASDIGSSQSRARSDV